MFSATFSEVKMNDSRFTRLDAHRVRIENPYGIPVNLFAGEDVPVENKAVTELLELLELTRTVERFAKADPEAFDTTPSLERVAITPDFHKAQGIPVGTVLQTRGFVVPQAIGSDVNCGMRLHLTSLNFDAVTNKLDELETAFRSMFFEAGRNIPMTRNQREGLFLNGLEGLLEATPKSLETGLWNLFQRANIATDLERIESRGSHMASQVFGLEDFLGQKNEFSRDSQIGSIGGGNHFVEIQRVEKILDRGIAHAWGIRPGMVTVMVHSGSVGIGHLSGSVYREVVRQMYPKALKHPNNGIFVLPTGQKHLELQRLFWDALANAANFAFANRLFLGLMAVSSLQSVLGEFEFPLLYDAPHNLVWREQTSSRDSARNSFVHRKGATTARGFEAMQNTPFAFTGEPVLVPGSMGSSSFILAGQGLPDALSSASHGAGRALARGAATRGHDAEFKRFLEEFRVVTPLDLRRQDVKMRRDILDKKLEELKQEAPHAYKGIGPVVKTLAGAGMARAVAELKPLMTIKG
jgi:tRNA-splicing ligase RtcB (3'-phosphate/5'-hydroxy nucleic acid ligase)